MAHERILSLLETVDLSHHTDLEKTAELPNHLSWGAQLEIGIDGLIVFLQVESGSPLDQCGIKEHDILQQVGLTKLLPRNLQHACTTIREAKQLARQLENTRGKTTNVSICYVPAAIHQRRHAVSPMRKRGDARRHGHYDQRIQRINPVDGRPLHSLRHKNKTNRQATDHYNSRSNENFDEDNLDRDWKEEDDIYFHKTRGGSGAYSKLQQFQQVTQSKQWRKKVDESFEFEHEVEGGVHTVLITWKD